MKSQQAIKAMNEIVKESTDEFGVLMLEVAQDANASLQNRIINTGYNAENRLFPPYSERYAKKRQSEGRQTGFVDFAFSGRMWSSVQVVSSPEEHKKGHARISTLSQEQMDKLSGNTEKKGTILDLNEEEIKFLSDKIETWLVDKWHENGL